MDYRLKRLRELIYEHTKIALETEQAQWYAPVCYVKLSQKQIEIVREIEATLDCLDRQLSCRIEVLEQVDDGIRR